MFPNVIEIDGKTTSIIDVANGIDGIIQKVTDGSYIIPCWIKEPDNPKVISEFISFNFQFLREGKEGILSEALLEAVKDNLIDLAGIVPSDLTNDAVAHIQLAINCLQERQKDRKERGVAGTLKP